MAAHDDQTRPALRRYTCRRKKEAEPADKPGSVVDSHSSGRRITARLKQPTRTRRGQRHEVPIWSCSRWGLPCRSVTGLAVRSYRTISPLPDPLRAIGGIFLLHFPSARAAQALSGTVPYGARTFLGTLASDATVWPTPQPGILRDCGESGLSGRCFAQRRGNRGSALGRRAGKPRRFGSMMMRESGMGNREKSPAICELCSSPESRLPIPRASRSGPRTKRSVSQPLNLRKAPCAMRP
jgi:hypothetical protein